MYSKKNKFIRIASSRFITLAIAIAILLVGLAFYRDFQQQRDINNEIDQLQAELDELEGKKVELAKLVDILESSNYIEKEARLRLGLKKPGEKVISVPDNARPEPRVLGAATRLEPEEPAYKQWLKYFFLNAPE